MKKEFINENVNVQQPEQLTGQVNNQAEVKGEVVKQPANLEQELAQKVGELKAQRHERETLPWSNSWMNSVHV